MKLYEITNQYQEILNQDEINLADLERINESLEEKAINVAAMIKNLEAEKNAVEQARKSMAEREKQLESKIDWLTNYLKESLESCKINEIKKSPYFAIKIKKCPPSILITDEGLIPNDYRKTKEIISIDRIKMKEEILQGVIIPGATIQQLTRLEIK